MAYCTLANMRSLLPKIMVISDENITTTTLQKPAGGASVLTPKEAQRLIELATEHIDSRLAPIYQVPLHRIVVAESAPISNIAKGATKIYVPDSGSYNVGQLVRLSLDNGTTELVTIKNIPDENIQEIELEKATVNAYPLSGGAWVQLIEYPDPIPSVCVKTAVSFAIDRQYVAEQSPDISNYGKTLRTQVSNDMDSILAGVSRLNGQVHTGRRFCRTSVLTAWKTVGEVQIGLGKES